MILKDSYSLFWYGYQATCRKALKSYERFNIIDLFTFSHYINKYLYDLFSIYHLILDVQLHIAYVSKDNVKSVSECMLIQLFSSPIPREIYGERK